jgi:hypothetical protein
MFLDPDYPSVKLFRKESRLVLFYFSTNQWTADTQSSKQTIYVCKTLLYENENRKAPERKTYLKRKSSQISRFCSLSNYIKEHHKRSSPVNENSLATWFLPSTLGI